MRAAALADVRSAHKRASRRVRAVMGDLAKLAEGRAIATNAAWLVAAASKARRGSTVLEGTDWSTGEAVIVRVEIDPAKPPRLQLDAIFRDAKRRAGGEATATTRLREAETAALALAAVMVEIELALDEGAITAAVERARLASPRDMPRLATSRSPRIARSRLERTTSCSWVAVPRTMTRSRSRSRDLITCGFTRVVCRERM